MNQQKYHICKLLDKERRVLGLPLEEFIPLLIILCVSFLLKAAMWGVIAGAIVFGVLRWAKQGQGAGWLYRKLYWFAPSCLFGIMLRKTPSSDNRHFLH